MGDKKLINNLFWWEVSICFFLQQKENELELPLDIVLYLKFVCVDICSIFIHLYPLKWDLYTVSYCIDCVHTWKSTALFE